MTSEVYIYFLKTDFGISYKLPANDLTISECLNQENIYLFYLPYFYILFYFYLFFLYFICILFLFIYYYYARGYLVKCHRK